ncbi:MAG TPA: aminopeptidase P family N-terminal domain-containing protein [Bryobacteraceae bacterium]|nr:aminopeptidase P family N-terminal domain-containing protein [Bryobacteraceae bacterium]
MPQANRTVDDTFRSRIEKLREAMKEFGLEAVIVEPGPAMTYLTGVRRGRSERTFALVVPSRGEIAFVVPGFEEMRARELIQPGTDIRIWQEDESPFERLAQILKDRGIVSGRIGLDPSVRFFVFDGVGRVAPDLKYVSAEPALKSAGADTPAPAQR